MMHLLARCGCMSVDALAGAVWLYELGSGFGRVGCRKMHLLARRACMGKMGLRWRGLDQASGMLD